MTEADTTRQNGLEARPAAPEPVWRTEGWGLELLSERAGIAQARDAVRRFLRENCAWAPSTAVTLVVSELVANAARHTSGWWRLGLAADARQLVVEVEDSSPEPPTPRHRPSTEGEGGFGLLIVAKLAARFEVEPRAAGKAVRAVWFNV